MVEEQNVLCVFSCQPQIDRTWALELNQHRGLRLNKATNQINYSESFT